MVYGIGMVIAFTGMFVALACVGCLLQSFVTHVAESHSKELAAVVTLVFALIVAGVGGIVAAIGAT